MTEIADDYPDPADAPDYDPDTDTRPTRYAEDLHAAAEAYAALPWWRRALVEEYRTRGETPPPPDAAI